MKNVTIGIFGAISSGVAYLFGGWDASLATLLIFMLIDYVSGVIVAGVFHNSPKTASGALCSRIGWKGLAKKCMTLAFVVIACRVDLVIGANITRDAVCIAFIVNELISIIENAKLMGVPIPAPISKAIDLLNSKAEEQKEE